MKTFKGTYMSTFKTINIYNPVDKVRWIDQVWKILNDAYSKVEGGLLFTDQCEIIRNTSIWKLIVENNKVIAVTIFKHKFGQKLVAMGTSNAIHAKEALIFLISHSLERTWMEVSEAVEVFIMKYCGGEKFLINQSEAVHYLNKTIETVGDGYHYIREIAGVSKTKILLGTPGYY